MNHVAETVGQNLNFNMTRLAQILLEVDLAIAEGGLGFFLRRLDGVGQFVRGFASFMPRPPPPAVALTSTG